MKRQRTGTVSSSILTRTLFGKDHPENLMAMSSSASTLTRSKHGQEEKICQV